MAAPASETLPESDDAAPAWKHTGVGGSQKTQNKYILSRVISFPLSVSVHAPNFSLRDGLPNVYAWRPLVRRVAMCAWRALASTENIKGARNAKPRPCRCFFSLSRTEREREREVTPIPGTPYSNYYPEMVNVRSPAVVELVGAAWVHAAPTQAAILAGCVGTMTCSDAAGRRCEVAGGGGRGSKRGNEFAAWGVGVGWV